MRYKASYSRTKGWAILMNALGILMIIAGFALFSILLLILGSMIFLYLWLIGRRLWVSLDENRIELQGWLNRVDSPLKDLKQVVHAESFPWPRNKYYGPTTYEIRTETQHAMINLLYFSPEFCRRFQELVVKNRGAT